MTGLATTKYLHKTGQPVVLFDSKNIKGNAKSYCDSEGIPFYTENLPEGLLKNFRKIYISPGIPQSAPILTLARTMNIEITNDINIASSQFDGHIIAVTGTNGKSTVTSLIAFMFQQLGFRAETAGNIGVSPLDFIMEPRPPDILVLELSSYQLETTRNLSAGVSVFTSFAPDHLERHGTIENYLAEKLKLNDQTKEDGALVFSECFWKFVPQDYLRKHSARAFVLKSSVETETVDRVSEYEANMIHSSQLETEFSIPRSWPHINRINGGLAAMAVKQLLHNDLVNKNIDWSQFRFLPYRMQLVKTVNSCSIINDSKSTNLESTIAAISSMKSMFYLFLGGVSKGECFEALKHFKHRFKKVLLFGSSAKQIFADIGVEQSLIFDDLASALEYFNKHFRQLDADVLFSPGGASFDEFGNYLERGEFFSENILKT